MPTHLVSSIVREGEEKAKDPASYRHQRRYRWPAPCDRGEQRAPRIPTAVAAAYPTRRGEGAR